MVNELLLNLSFINKITVVPAITIIIIIIIIIIIENDPRHFDFITINNYHKPWFLGQLGFSHC